MSFYLILKQNSISKRARETEIASVYWDNKNSEKPLHWLDLF